MRCPACHHPATRVVDSRVLDEGQQIRRRRECERCQHRFTTFEQVEVRLPVVIKSNQARQPFDEKKVRVGIAKALEKRPVEAERVEQAVQAILREVMNHPEREIASQQIGRLVMRELRRLDQVAYVRFASVYLNFGDLNAFRDEIEQLERDLPTLLGDRQMSLLR